jgi:nicotinate-nucleotide pyrophosphorylase (carboxylating)
LLDNMTPEQVRACVTAASGRARLEVSGGVNLENIRAYAETGVDCISVGALTHSAPSADINFLIQPL